ncbi:hypothetical protein GC101_34145 [Paenibacillus sp. LMG 31459]|uniref:ADP-ribosylglycohydrolase n=1 Tax=Paenibacillus phytohabitans TaxID=2654978 RepID=A0ABX1YSM7_9BACL|nr:ADP-ribosylglycohydrolase family protein [Paenibacillus phytohabitans]NOU83898.1 hypothetical protein [Paenibacillus phytohabitans]
MNNESIVNIKDKYFGSLLGAMIGDALGWAFEDRSNNVSRNAQIQRSFLNWTRKSGGKFYLHEEEITAGSYSDDTQLIFATARSLQYKNWYSHFVRIELPAWIIYERGGGGATKRAAESWSNGNQPWRQDKQSKENIKRYFDAGGNGVAMRILPHVFYCDGDLEELSKQVFLNGISTHGHPRALLSAIVYAWAIDYVRSKEEALGYGELIAYLLQTKDRWSKLPEVQNNKEWRESADQNFGGKYLECWSEVVLEIQEGLEIAYTAVRRGLLDKSWETLNNLKCFDKSVRGAGTVATLVSLYMASKYAADPANGILELAGLKNADTDTIASMAGGILGTIHGTEWIPTDWLLVQDYDYARKLTTALGYNTKEENTEPLWSSSNNKRFREQLAKIKLKQDIQFGPFKSVTLIDVKKNRTNIKNLNVTTYKLLATEGQTIFIKTFFKSATEDKTTTYEAKKKENQVKNHSLSLNVETIENLLNVLPPNIKLATALKLISKLLNELSQETINIDEIVKRHVSKSIDKEQMNNLVNFIVKNISSN